MKKAEAIRKLKAQADAIRALGATLLYLFGSTRRSRSQERP
jgi:uncharacterized protein